MHAVAEIRAGRNAAKRATEPEEGSDVVRATVSQRLARERVRVCTRTGGESFVATLAAVGYAEPEPGDRVLVARGRTEAFVIGVLGPARLATRGVLRAPDGDLRLEVPEGSLTLHARDGVVVEGERSIELRTSVLTFAAELVETEAERVVERAKAAYREVEDLVQTRAGRIRTIARTTLSLFGQRSVLTAKDEVKIDAARIHIG